VDCQRRTQWQSQNMKANIHDGGLLHCQRWTAGNATTASIVAAVVAKHKNRNENLLAVEKFQLTGAAQHSNIWIAREEPRENLDI